MLLEYENMNAIPVNDSIVVLTKKDGQGWHMAKGEVIKFCYEGFCADGWNSMSVGLMKNDIFQFGQRQSMKNTSCHLIIPEDGLYHLCILIS